MLISYNALNTHWQHLMIQLVNLVLQQEYRSSMIKQNIASDLHGSSHLLKYIVPSKFPGRLLTQDKVVPALNTWVVTDDATQKYTDRQKRLKLSKNKTRP